jgi:carbon monoxide dehydrogenase subunit G
MFKPFKLSSFLLKKSFKASPCHNFFCTSKSFPDILTPYDVTINAPIESVWSCISDFGNWTRWTSSFTNMKIEGDGVDKVGCIRIFQSTETKTIYEEKELEKDNIKHILKFGLVSAQPPTPFIEKQVVSATLEAAGENQTRVHYLVTITPNVQIPEETIKKFQAIGYGTYDKMFGDLKSYLKNKQK